MTVSQPRRRSVHALIAALLAFGPSPGLTAPVPAVAPPPFTAAQLEEARLLRERCLVDDTGYETLRSLTRNVGPRFAGSPGDALAVDWALKRMRELGLKNVHAEPVTVPHWIRGNCSVEVTSPTAQTLAAVALGGSVATPESGLEADVVPVTNLDELARIDSTRLEGRIVFYTGRAARGGTVGLRPGGDRARSAPRRPLGAAPRGHPPGGHDAPGSRTGGRPEAGDKPIPALAISNPDADLLEDPLASGRRRLRMRNSRRADARSERHREIPGREKPREVVVPGAHPTLGPRQGARRRRRGHHHRGREVGEAFEAAATARGAV
jgi:hypothetical protein